MLRAQATQQVAEHPIVQQQRASWDKFSPGWERWDRFTMDFLDAQGRAIVEHLAPAGNERILDVATGTGEPGLTLAARVPFGSVTGVDISSGMLAIAEKKAAGRGLDNFATLSADACQLPFADDSFDAVSCRLGFMFFPEPEQAAREFARVLRPGGKIVTTVWGGPEDNPWISVLMNAIQAHMALPSPAPGAPGLFRCAGPRAVSSLFEAAGLHAVDQDLHGQIECATPEQYFSFMSEVVPPVVAALESASVETVAAIRRHLFEALQPARTGDATSVAWRARLIAARK